LHWQFIKVIFSYCKSGFLNLWAMAHGRILDGPRPCVIEIGYVLLDETLNRKRGLLLS